MSRLRILADPDFTPALDRDVIRPDFATGLGSLDHPPRILLLYGSLRERSFSRLAVEEAARLLILFGAEVRIFDPSDLPLPDQVKADARCLKRREGGVLDEFLARREHKGKARGGP
ncbi:MULTISPECIES: NAD(P)H-dependent oxidoreductase, partial [Sphingomonadales]|uniref:NADPH-dependent FMN reductase n=1 Tax=Sphingomonadales TaxID=204457 RepID=UPI0018D201A7